MPADRNLLAILDLGQDQQTTAFAYGCFRGRPRRLTGGATPPAADAGAGVAAGVAARGAARGAAVVTAFLGRPGFRFGGEEGGGKEGETFYYDVEACGSRRPLLPCGRAA